jgi:hypothetical protein
MTGRATGDSGSSRARSIGNHCGRVRAAVRAGLRRGAARSGEGRVRRIELANSRARGSLG